MQNPYLTALELVQKHVGTHGQAALAKCILSLYNHAHAFSIGEILAPLGAEYKEAVLAMVNDYSLNGETPELRIAGEYVRQNFPRLIELSVAMSIARSDVREKWVSLDNVEM
jgi:hypothetical protein